MRSRTTVAIVAFVALVLVLWIWAAGLNQQCTTDELCTLDRCPDRCSRPEQLFLLGTGGLLIVSAAFVLGGRISRRLYAVVMVGVTVIAAAAIFVSAR